MTTMNDMNDMNDMNEEFHNAARQVVAHPDVEDVYVRFDTSLRRARSTQRVLIAAALVAMVGVVAMASVKRSQNRSQ